MTDKGQLYLGLDGGGTKCRAALMAEDGSLLGKGLSGSANVSRDFDQASSSIVEASINALENAGIDKEELKNVRVGAGLAGAGLASTQRKLAQWKHPFASFDFTTDLHTACLGAHEGEDGATLIVGTGSCAARIMNGKVVQLGGHGFALGDQGSGAWTGREAVSRVLCQMDGIYPKDEMFEMISQTLDIKTQAELVDKMNNGLPREFAHIAPKVLQLAHEGVSQAQEIINVGADYLSKLCRLLLEGNDLKLCLVGGLSLPLSAWLDDDIRVRLNDPHHSPEWGAIHFCKTNLSNRKQQHAN